MWNLRVLLVFIAWASGLMILGAQATTVVQEGRSIAIDACSACHQVLRDQKPPPDVFDPDEDRGVPAPSFAQIARKYHGKLGRLRAFITTPRHPMREQDWEPSDLDAVTHYIESLPHAGKQLDRR